MQSKPTHSVSFEAVTKDQHVLVDGHAWADEEGIYKTSISAVWFDGADVIGFLSKSELSDLENGIPDAIANETIGE